MADMVEPDRTILIVSIIGLVIIWGSFFYHKYVQGGSRPEPEDAPGESGAREAAGGEAGAAEPGPAAAGAGGPQGKGRRGRRRR
ncbi:MAG: hypothetical protein AB1505_10015 [Candidatus Latescibacterota bacterium]